MPLGCISKITDLSIGELAVKNSVNDDVNLAHFLFILTLSKTEALLIICPTICHRNCGKMYYKWGLKSNAEKGRKCVPEFAVVLWSNYGVEKLYSMFNGASRRKDSSVPL